MRHYVDPVDRILAHSVALPCGCWQWTGSFNNVGRPRIAVRIKGRSQWVTVARYVVQFVHGGTWGRNQARRKVSAHSCDYGECVHPNHIAPSTQKRNVRECVARARHIAGTANQHGTFIVPAGVHAGKHMVQAHDRAANPRKLPEDGTEADAHRSNSNRARVDPGQHGLTHSVTYCREMSAVSHHQGSCNTQ